jgi:hypothetical protein
MRKGLRYMGGIHSMAETAELAPVPNEMQVP